jgi:hypothetical protein
VDVALASKAADAISLGAIAAGRHRSWKEQSALALRAPPGGLRDITRSRKID